MAAVGLLALQTATSCDDADTGGGGGPGQGGTGVEGWFFKAAYTYPVALTFEPVVLFSDGDYVEVEDQPVEDLAEADDKRDRPYAWGTWRKEGDTYYLTDYEGTTTDYRFGTDTWFPAYPYLPEVPLAAGYENTTGGDYGNGVSALFKTRIDFPQEGYFYHSFDGGILTPDAAGWDTNEDAGTYTVADHTMVLAYNTGQEVRASFALGAEGNPPRPSSDIIFIGGDVFLPGHGSPRTPRPAS